MVCGGEARCKKRRKVGGREVKRRWRKGREKKMAIAIVPGLGIRGLSFCEGKRDKMKAGKGI